VVRIEANEELIKQIKEKYPELSRMKPTDIMDWALRRTLEEA
jgi:uncharacterized protein (DUF433 family)